MFNNIKKIQMKALFFIANINFEIIYNMSQENECLLRRDTELQMPIVLSEEIFFKIQISLC